MLVKRPFGFPLFDVQKWTLEISAFIKPAAQAIRERLRQITHATQNADYLGAFPGAREKLKGRKNTGRIEPGDHWKRPYAGFVPAHLHLTACVRKHLKTGHFQAPPVSAWSKRKGEKRLIFQPGG